LNKKKARQSRSQQPPKAGDDDLGGEVQYISEDVQDISENIFSLSVPAQPSGNVDVISHEVISGWAWNPLDPEECVLVDIYDAGDLLIRVRADMLREDLRDAGIGTGKYGFSVPNPAALLPLARHHIAVRRAEDGVDLSGSPQWMLRPEAGLDFSLTRFIESAASASASLARVPDDLDQHLSLTLHVLNQLLNARHTLNESRPLLAIHAFKTYCTKRKYPIGPVS
jgi:hypothetical protein